MNKIEAIYQWQQTYNQSNLQAQLKILPLGTKAAKQKFAKISMR